MHCTGLKSVFHVVQTLSGAHPTSYLMDTDGPSPGVKQLGREVEVKNTWSYTSTLHVFTDWFLIKLSFITLLWFYLNRF
jgi:hypothetical protein